MHEEELKEGMHAVLVCSRAEAEIMGRTAVKDGVTSTFFHTMVSIEPALYLVAVRNNSFVLELARKSRVFSVNFMGAEYREAVKECARTESRHTDKFMLTGLTKREGEKIDCPVILEAYKTIECTLLREEEAGDHTLLIGDIVHVEEKD